MTKKRHNFIGSLQNLSDRKISLAFVLAVTIAILAFFLPISLITIQELVRRGEMQDAINETSRITRVVDNELARMEKTNRDWSGWDDTYQFVQDSDQKYITNNLNDDILKNLGINLFLITDQNGKIIALRNIDLAKGSPVPLAFQITDLMKKYPQLFHFQYTNASEKGIVTLGDQNLLVTAFPILTSTRQGPIRGSLIFGTYLDQTESETLSNLANRQLAFWGLNHSALPGSITPHVVLNSATPITIAPLSDATLAGYQVLKELNGGPGVIMQTNIPRDLYKLGRTISILFSGLFITICLALTSVLYYLIYSYMKSRRDSRQALERFRAVFDQSADAILLIDANGLIVEANNASQKMLNLDLQEVRKVSMMDIFTSEPPFELGVFTVDEQEQAVKEYLCTLRDGAHVHIEMSGSEVHSLDTKAYSIILRDVTARKEAQAALQESEARYQLAMRGANDGLWDWDIQTSQMYYSPRWKSMLGFNDDGISDSPNEWFDRVHADDLILLKAKLNEHLEKHSENFAYEHRILNKDGDYRWMLARGVAVWNPSGYAVRMAGSLTDISVRKRIEEQLRFDALHDGLTGVGNRTLLLDRLNHANLRKKRKPDQIFAVFFLDLDRFKQINDTYGHPVGDKILVEVSQRLKGNHRLLDTVARTTGPETLARIAGDEFVILVEDIRSARDVDGLIDRIQKVMSKPYMVEGNEVCIGVSVGVVVPDVAYDHPEDIIRDADIAMYKAKQKGGTVVVRFTREMYEKTAARMQLENDLRRALERSEFVVHYQPIFALADDHIVGLEALVRWNHPHRGLLMPKDFIDIAEETGMIVSMGHWVLREACIQMKRWQQQFGLENHLIISVNLSARQLASPDLLEMVERVLWETDYDPRDLWLEVTETTLIENLAVIRQVMTNLRELGIHIEIDDFGVGYSSLSYIQNLPIDGFKIDRSFIQEISGSGQQIVNTLVALGQNLKLKQVAEGVETQEQKEYLQKLSCAYMQGYLMARPMSSERLEAFLGDRQMVDRQQA